MLSKMPWLRSRYDAKMVGGAVDAQSGGGERLDRHTLYDGWVSSNLVRIEADHKSKEWIKEASAEKLE